MLNLTIKDEGAGIAPADLERIFEKFYRGHLTKHIPGTGLGLAICKSIVEAHGGHITAMMNGNRGTAIHKLDLYNSLRKMGMGMTTTGAKILNY